MENENNFSILMRSANVDIYQSIMDLCMESYDVPIIKSCSLSIRKLISRKSSNPGNDIYNSITKSIIKDVVNDYSNNR